MFIYFGSNIFNQLSNIGIENSKTVLSSQFKCFSKLFSTNNQSIDDVYISWSYLLFKTDEKIYHSGYWKQDNKQTNIKEVTPLNEKEIIDISCGLKKSLKLLKSGQCFAFSDKYFHPQIIDFGESNDKIKSVNTDDLHALALTIDGKVYALIGEENLSPTFLQLPVPIKEVACGKEHVLLLSECGRIFSYGFGSRGQLGHGTIENVDEPIVIEALDGIKINSISCGGWHSAAVSAEGDLYMWGWNESGQLGLPCNELQGDSLPMAEIETVCCLPMVIDLGGELIRQVGCGSRHTAALTENKHLWTWGWNGYGQLGHNGMLLSDKPKKVDLPEHFHPSTLKCKFWSTLIVGSFKDSDCIIRN